MKATSQMKPELFLLSIVDYQHDKNKATLLRFMTSVASQGTILEGEANFNTRTTATFKVWEMAEKAKLSELFKDKALTDFLKMGGFIGLFVTEWEKSTSDILYDFDL